MTHSRRTQASRRDFLKTASTGFAAAAVTGAMRTPVHAAGDETLKVALIGCGARGAGAAVQAISTAGPVKLWAMADAFSDRLESCLNSITRGMAASYDRDSTPGLGSRIEVPKERRFVGLDAYRHAVDSGVDVVLLVEPPGFRPQHFEYAVQAGKHVFMEKPVATDVAGVQRVLDAAAVAKQKNLKVGVGLQRRHQASYLDAIERIEDGEIGSITSLRCYWNGSAPAKTPVPRGDMSELEYQVRNWYFFNWLSGDHICEQHVHNLDVCNWILGGHPIEAQGQGGRQVRVGDEYGDIFDHHMVEFTYPDGTKMWSQCRQIPGCSNQVAEVVHGSTGILKLDARGAQIDVEDMRLWRSKRARKKSEYQVEHDVLFDAIRNNRPHNEAEYGATSTMTGILGRMATYSGKVVTWDEAIASNQQLTIDAEAWDSPSRTQPDASGKYPIAIPGVTHFA
jgi:myo-inositol 2-dehydrogenase / D-chiro-inositol 1-dehydrogenase